MIEIKNVDVYGWQAAIRGMRNSWNSWNDSDSHFRVCAMPGKTSYAEIGQNDLTLTKKLAADGSDERKFMLNLLMECYRKTNDKNYWRQIIQLLPSSYNQRRTVQLNYEALLKIYRARKNHKLDEWRTFCSWIETLPYMSEFLGGE